MKIPPRQLPGVPAGVAPTSWGWNCTLVSSQDKILSRVRFFKSILERDVIIIITIKSAISLIIIILMFIVQGRRAWICNDQGNWHSRRVWGASLSFLKIRNVIFSCDCFHHYDLLLKWTGVSILFLFYPSTKSCANPHCSFAKVVNLSFSSHWSLCLRLLYHQSRYNCVAQLKL